MNQANMLILSGGFGTRLRSVVSDVPKPLAPVIDRPYLYYLIEHLAEQGLTSLTFLLHHQADLIEAFLQELKSDRRFKGCELRTLTEPKPLGTGGAIAYAVQQLQLSGAFLVTNADTWLGSGVKQILEVETPSIALVRVNNAERYGRVQFQHNKVVSFDEKQSSAGPEWINAGLYHLHADLFQNWNGLSFSLERDLFPKLVSNGRLRALPLAADFIDIGIPDDYFRFCRWIESGKTGVLHT